MGDKYAKQIRISQKWSNIKKIILEIQKRIKITFFSATEICSPMSHTNAPECVVHTRIFP